MANPTVLEFKTAVAGQLGKSNAAVVVAKRDTACNEAIKRYINENSWRWNRKTNTVTVTSGYGSLPTDMSTDFEAVVYRYDGTTKITYRKCELDDIAQYTGSGSPHYAIDEVNRRLYLSEDVVTSIRYQKLPPTLLFDLSDDSTALPFPDKTTPVQLAIGMYWLAAERDEDEFDRFVDKHYFPLLKRDKRRDGAAGPSAVATSPRSGFNLGWNRNRR